jgi:hypothetical protein
MKQIEEIRTYKTFNELYQDFIKSTNCEHSDGLKSVIYMEINDKGLIEENNILFIYDALGLLD